MAEDVITDKRLDLIPNAELLGELRQSADLMRLQQLLLMKGITKKVELALREENREHDVKGATTALLRDAYAKVEGADTAVAKIEETLSVQTEIYQNHLKAYQEILSDPLLNGLFPNVRSILDCLKEERLETDLVLGSDKITLKQKTSILARHEKTLNEDIVYHIWEYIFRNSRPAMKAIVVTSAAPTGEAQGSQAEFLLTDTFRSFLQRRWYFTRLQTDKFALTEAKKRRGAKNTYDGKSSNQPVVTPSPFEYLGHLKFSENEKGQSEARMIGLLVKVMERLRTLNQFETAPAKQ
ncbi:hypothetical protein HZA45_01840 [Candidatus Peregrinibacteria bacterium]|nr:hypothetical protein [Candidatus Peregrinibacteria bacterium]